MFMCSSTVLHCSKPKKAFKAKLWGLILITVLFCSAFLIEAQATHFRFGQITWKQAGGNTVEATIENVFRRNGFRCLDPGTLGTIPCSHPDGFPGVGDVIAETIGGTIFNWGDGSPPVGSPTGQLLYVIRAIDPVNNWVAGLALDPMDLPALNTTHSHTYDDPGNYTAFIDSCCRISRVLGVNEHINNPDGGYRVETVINVGTTNNSPVSSLPPIVLCPIEGLCQFTVPASAGNPGDPLNFRLSTPSEASSFGSFVQPGPPNATFPASIDPVTGLYSWDTTGATRAGNPSNNSLYSTQVTIEDSTSKIALDFFIQVDGNDPDPPVITPPAGSPPVCETTQVLTVGTTKTFDVTGSDPDAGDTVTLNVSGLPLGATMTPSLPIMGNPVSSTFAWTPTETDEGTHLINFNATSSAGGLALCPVTLEVIAALKVDIEVNPFLTFGNGVILVSILSSDTFDASTVDPGTVRVGPGEAVPFGMVGTIRDENGDGRNDMVVSIYVEEAALACGSAEVALVGRTFSGQMIMGSGSVRVIGCF